MKWLLTILPFFSFAQGIVGIGYGNIGFSASAGIDIGKVRTTIGYSLPLISAVNPRIYDISLGYKFDAGAIVVIPKFGGAKFKKSEVINGELILVTSKYVPKYGIEINKPLPVGSIFISANYCEWVYYSLGVNAYIKWEKWKHKKA